MQSTAALMSLDTQGLELQPSLYRTGVCVCTCVCVCVTVYNVHISPQPLIQLLCPLLVRPLSLAIVVQRSQSEVVHVDPNGAPPVGGVVLCIVLGGERGTGQGVGQGVG